MIEVRRYRDGIMNSALPKVKGFELQRLIGRGGSASVYEARDPRHGRTVAIKIIDVRRFDPSSRRAFSRELQAMGRLADHPNVVDLFDSGFTKDGSPYLIMPLLESGTLQDRLTTEGAMSVATALELTISIASALETAHRRGILHCDIKPSNLFIGPFNSTLVGDFGISSVAYTGITTTKDFGVTVRYTAPEVLDDEDVSVRSDIYSLGATLYSLIEGRPPYSGDSPTAVIKEIFLKEQFPRLTVEAPPALADFIQEMAAIDPTERPESMVAVVDRLQAIQEAQGLAITTGVIGDKASKFSQPEALNPDPTVAPIGFSAISELDDTRVEAAAEHRKPKVPMVLGLAAAAVSVVVVLGAFLLWRPPSSAQVEVGGLTEERVEIAQGIEDDIELATGGDDGDDTDGSAEPIDTDTTSSTTSSTTTEANNSEEALAATTVVDDSSSSTAPPTTETSTSTTTTSTSTTTTSTTTTSTTTTSSTTTTTSTTVAPSSSEVVPEPTPAPEPVIEPASDTTEPAAQKASLTGSATDEAGQVVDGVRIALYEATSNPVDNPVGKRGEWLVGQSPDNAGAFNFSVDPGCYILAYNAPEGYSWEGGGAIVDVGTCADDAETTVRAETKFLVKTAVEDSTFGGWVLLEGVGVDGVKVDAYLATDANARDSFVKTTNTDSTGAFSFSLAEGCYTLTFEAPEGRTFTNDSNFINSPTVCIDPDTSGTADAELAP